MPLLETKGAGSAQGFGLSLQTAAPITYPVVDQVYNNFVYYGNETSTTITTGVDLSSGGGLIILKNTSTNSDWIFSDTVATTLSNYLSSNTQNAQQASSAGLSVSSTGVTITGNNIVSNGLYTYSLSSFKVAPRFFDIVTWTGDGTSSRTLTHNLTIAPGLVIVKCRSAGTTNWPIRFNNLTSHLNSGNDVDSTAVQDNGYISAYSASGFTLSAGSVGVADVNASGQTYVAYVFANDTADNGIIKVITTAGGSVLDEVGLPWKIQTAFGTTITTNGSNTSESFLAQVKADNRQSPTYATRFLSTEGYASGVATAVVTANFSNNLYKSIVQTYLAYPRTLLVIKKSGYDSAPTSSSDIFAIYTRTGNNASTYYTTPISDWSLFISKDYAVGTLRSWYQTNISGLGQATALNSTAKISTSTGITQAENFKWSNRVWYQTVTGYNNTLNQQYITYLFKDAKNYFSSELYTGNAANRDVMHSLGVVPEMIWVRPESPASGSNLICYHKDLGNTQYITLTAASLPATGSTYWRNLSPSNIKFYIGTSTVVNASSTDYRAYLFATCPGVSKVGSYTGTGSDLTIDCGFTSGVKFLWIRSTSGSALSYIYDTTRGIVTAGNDSMLNVLSTAQATATSDDIDVVSSGFVAKGTGLIGVSGRQYIYFAIA